MKSLAIVSSYNELCGNASYTHVLKKEFERYYKVEVIPLDTQLLRFTNKTFVQLGDEHIKQIAEKLRKFDYVNIQFESALFARSTDIAFRRVLSLVDAAPNLVFTMHRVDVITESLYWSMHESYLRGSFINLIKELRSRYLYCRATGGLIKKLKKYSAKKNVWIMVHTKHDAEMIRRVFGFNNVVDHPLSYLNSEEIAKYKADADQVKFKLRYKLPSDAKTVGIFGFISGYKGYDTAIRAMAYLPKNYHLLIFGGQHPLEIKANCPVDPYIGSQIDLIEKGKLRRRIHFLGSVSDDDFINGLICSDVTVLPYIEVGQSMSGNVALALEVGARTIVSNSKTFLKLRRYLKDGFVSFDMGNYVELAQKIANYDADFSNELARYIGSYNIHTSGEAYKKMFEAADSA